MIEMVNGYVNINPAKNPFRQIRYRLMPIINQLKFLTVKGG